MSGSLVCNQYSRKIYKINFILFTISDVSVPKVRKIYHFVNTGFAKIVVKSVNEMLTSQNSNSMGRSRQK